MNAQGYNLKKIQTPSTELLTINCNDHNFPTLATIDWNKNSFSSFQRIYSSIYIQNLHKYRTIHGSDCLESYWTFTFDNAAISKAKNHQGIRYVALDLEFHILNWCRYEVLSNGKRHVFHEWNIENCSVEFWPLAKILRIILI